MPVSPNNKNNQTPNLNSSDGSDGNQTKRSRRKTLQNLKRRFADLRERAQLAGLIPTVPEGAVRNERVKTADQPQPELVERAIRSGWAVPEEIKPELVQEMIAVVQDEESSDKTKVAAFRALLTADQAQHERDNPQTKGKSTQVNVSVQTNIAAVDVLRESLKKVDIQMERKIKDI